MVKIVPIRIEMWEMFDTKVRVTVPWLRTNSSIWWTFSFECADAPLAKLWCDPAQIWAHLLVATWSSLSVIRTTGRAATRRECSMANSAAPMHNLHRPSDNNGRSRSYRHICITHKTKEENRRDIWFENASSFRHRFPLSVHKLTPYPVFLSAQQQEIRH